MKNKSTWLVWYLPQEASVQNIKGHQMFNIDRNTGSLVKLSGMGLDLGGILRTSGDLCQCRRRSSTSKPI